MKKKDTNTVDTDLVLLELNEKWNFQLPFGWMPISGDAPKQHIEIYQAEHFQDILGGLIATLKSKFNLESIYEINEDGQVSIQKIDDCNFCYMGLEHFYTDFDYNFAIYFSHEYSVTIGGDPLLAEVPNFWPEHNRHIWKGRY